jgi:DNA transposition AAA+ family ATPase
MTQINHDVVRSAIRELIDSKTISGAALARETGTSTATVSQFLNGKYKGDNDTVAASLNTWLESHNPQKPRCLWLLISLRRRPLRKSSPP